MAPRKVNAELSTGKLFGESVAIAALGFLAAEAARLERFLACRGLGPHNLREAAADAGFLAAVLDYVASDERLLSPSPPSEGWTRRAIARARRELRRGAAVARAVSAGEAKARGALLPRLPRRIRARAAGRRAARNAARRASSTRAAPTD